LFIVRNFPLVTGFSRRETVPLVEDEMFN